MRTPEQILKMQRDLFNGFIEKWCPENYAHFIDTDENEAERYRKQVDNILITSHINALEGQLKDIPSDLLELAVNPVTLVWKQRINRERQNFRNSITQQIKSWKKLLK